jgi:methionyl aminopeptidase
MPWRPPVSIESPADWAGLRRVARIVREVLDDVEAALRPGVTTADLDAVAAQVLARHDAQSAPTMIYGFPGHVLISVNEEIVHGVPGRRRITRGDLVSLDATVVKDGFIADAARTIVMEAASDEARRLAECARAAFDAGLAVARAGTLVSEIGRAVEGEVRRRGFAVARGLSGHGVGRKIHEWPDVPNWFDAGQRDVLAEGLVLTIEPMVCAGSGRTATGRDGWTVRTRDRRLAAHHEHTLVITRDRPVILTADAA